MYTQTYFFPETSNFHTISSPYNVIKNISIFKSYQKKHSPKKPSIVDKMGNIIFALNKNNDFYSTTSTEPNISGITMLDETIGIIQNNNLNLSKNFRNKNNNSILSNTAYTYLLRKNRKVLRKFDLQRNEKTLSKSLEILYKNNNLRNYHFPKYYSYQPPGTPRCIQDVYIKYSNQKRNLKLKMMERNDYDELKHKIVSFRRHLYNPKNI
jgi:hypothetical protein